MHQPRSSRSTGAVRPGYAARSVTIEFLMMLMEDAELLRTELRGGCNGGCDDGDKYGVPTAGVVAVGVLAVGPEDPG